MQDTLAHEWRRRMAARSSLCAMLLAVPVGVAALIGFSAGPGGLPLGISALTSGPTESAIGVPSDQGRSGALAGIARVASATPLAIPTTTATAAAGAPLGVSGGGDTGLIGGGSP